jgi:serine/threonine protein kinase
MEAAARLPESDPLAVMFEDGLGQRFRVADPAGDAGLEILTLRSSFATVPSFEFALRERAGRLAPFRHAYYARVRSVERTSGVDPQLRVISDAGQGLRLSELLAGAQSRRVPIDINAALCVIRQLVPAVAMLHESARDVAHGALAPERLLVSSQARLLIVEYVLGAALEQLRYTRERYWTELRIPLPPSSLSPRFDHRCDVTQIGVVALSLILGRPLRQEEFPDRIADVVASTWAVSPRGGFEPLPPGLRGWLARALQLDPHRSFQSAVDARAELDTVLGDSELVAAPASLEAFLTRYHASEAPAVDIQSTPRESESRPQRTARADQRPASPVREEAKAPAPPPSGPDRQPVGSSAFRTSAPISEEAASHPFASVDARLIPGGPRHDGPERDGGFDAPRSVSDLVTPGLTSVTEQPASLPSAVPERQTAVPFTFDDSRPTEYERGRDIDGEREEGGSRWWKNWRVLGAAVAVVAVIAAGSSIGARKPSAEPEVHAASGTLEVSTNPAGVQAFIDGDLRGVTPVVMALEPGTHTLELRGAGEPRSIPITVGPGARVSQYVELSGGGPSAARPSPEPHAPDTPTATGAAAAAANAPAPAPAPPANGSVTVTSPIELQVYENGTLVGTTRERLSLALGRHQLELVNATLGVRSTETVQVSSARTTSIAPALPTGTLSLNAVPWAEVWLDGEKLGETPIGNVSVRVGSHDVVFRHPELGERHQTVVVSVREPARLSVTMQGR